MNIYTRIAEIFAFSLIISQFRKKHFIVLPIKFRHKVFSGKRLSGKVTFRETSVNEPCERVRWVDCSQQLSSLAAAAGSHLTDDVRPCMVLNMNVASGSVVVKASCNKTNTKTSSLETKTKTRKFRYIREYRTALSPRQSLIGSSWDFTQVNRVGYEHENSQRPMSIGLC